MKKIAHCLIYLLVITLSILSLSCENPSGQEPEDSEILNQIEDVSKVDGGENVTITVNKDNEAFFRIDFNGIDSNDVINNSAKEGWCIDWQKPIDSDNGTYNGITLYSTYRVESWKSVNYLLNIKDELSKDDPDITYREIQIAIWSLRAFPEFNLDEVKTEDLPGRMVTDGERNFSSQKVEEILGVVESGYKEFEFTQGTKFAVIGATPADVQTVITVVE